MRIVNWNCNGAFRRKYDRIEAIGADVYVIQECEDPASSSPDYQYWAGQYIWSGNPGKKGMGVFVKNGLSVTPLDWPNHGLEHFLPVRIDHIDLLAVWTKNSPRMGYIGQFWQYLQYHSELFSSKTILCGDLNSNSIWDRRGRIWNHSECVSLLSSIDFRSAYHAHFNENQGEETQPTFYLHRNIAKPYHIDYFFTHLKFNGTTPSVSVGDSVDWLSFSDHMPVTLTI
jgi:exonuclease III